MNKEKRGGRTTKAQYELFVQELENNIPFKDNRFDAKNPDVINNFWNNLAVRLNSLGGPVRDVSGWKKIFTDWKSQVRGKARKLKSVGKQTGNVGEFTKPLTGIEEKLLDLTGIVVVDGLPVEELGIDESDTENITYTPTADEEQEKNINVTSETSVSEKGSVPTKKRKRDVLGQIQQALPQWTSQEANKADLLTEINNNMKSLVKIQKKRLKLEKKKFMLKYLEFKIQQPGYELMMSSSEDESP